MPIDSEQAMELFRHFLKLYRSLDEELLATRMMLVQLGELAGKTPALIDQVESLRKSDTVQSQMDRKYSDILAGVEAQAASPDALQMLLQWKPTGPVN